MNDKINMTIKTIVRSKYNTNGIKLRCNGEVEKIENGSANFVFNVTKRTLARYDFTLDPSHPEWEIDENCGTVAPLLGSNPNGYTINLTLKKSNIIKSLKIKHPKQGQIMEVGEEFPSFPVYTTEHSLQSLDCQTQDCQAHPHPKEIFYLEAETSFDLSELQEAQKREDKNQVKWGYYLKGISEDLEEPIPNLSQVGIATANPQPMKTIQTARVNLEEILQAHKDEIISLSNPNQGEANQNQTTSNQSQSDSNNSSQTSNQTHPIDFHIVFLAYLDSNDLAHENPQYIQTHLILRVLEIPLLSFYREEGKVKLRVDYKQKREEVEIDGDLPSKNFNNIKAKIQEDGDNYKLTIENQDLHSHNTQEFKIASEGLELLKDYFKTTKKGKK